MKSVKFIEQMEHSECGLACVAMICNYCEYEITLSSLREIYGVPVGGYTLLQLNQILSDFNISSKGIKIHNIDLLDKSFFPLIAFWDNKHFVIIEKVKEKKVLVVDPASGKRWVSREEFSKKFSNKALYIKPDISFEKHKEKNKLSYFWPILQKNRLLLFTLVILSILVQIIGILVPTITQKLIDNVIVNINTAFLNKIGLCTVIFSISYYLLNLLRGYIIVKLQTLFDSELMTNLLDHLLNLPYSFFTNRSSGELLYRINSNIYIRQILTQRFVSIFIDSLLIFVYLVMMFNYSLSLSLLVVLTSIILIGISAFNSYKINQITNIEILQQALVQKNLTEMINGIITIKSMGKEKLFFSNWKDAFSTQLKYSKQKGNWSAILSNISNTIQFIFPMVTIWLGSYNLKNHFFTLGMLVAFNALSSSFLQPIISLSSSYTDIVVLKTYLSKLYDIINTKPETGLSKDLYKKIDGNIALNNVYFKYTKFDLYTIKNVSLNINAGEKIAIVGRSGSGKSTLLKLLLGLYSPDNGEIYIDKTNISQINVRNYRNQIGIVLQEPQLFNASIKENIILGKNNVSEEELKLAANKAGIYDIIENCPLGLETIISENGINLSGGQRQKISLARALINNPKILFMDEPTSSLDNEAEKDFMNQIFKLDTTCIVISHRLSTIDKFSKVIVMDNGQIVECGTHYELMRNKRHYYNLYSNGI